MGAVVALEAIMDGASEFVLLAIVEPDPTCLLPRLRHATRLGRGLLSASVDRCQPV